MIAQLKPSVYPETAGCIFRRVESDPIWLVMHSLSSALSAKPVDFDVEYLRTVHLLLHLAF